MPHPGSTTSAGSTHLSTKTRPLLPCMCVHGCIGSCALRGDLSYRIVASCLLHLYLSPIFLALPYCITPSPRRQDDPPLKHVQVIKHMHLQVPGHTCIHSSCTSVTSNYTGVVLYLTASLKLGTSPAWLAGTQSVAQLYGFFKDCQRGWFLLALTRSGYPSPGTHPHQASWRRPRL
ncbi:hypothetical protein VUR80DRAFT_8967 [Thermomyces stellatus]